MAATKKSQFLYPPQLAREPGVNETTVYRLLDEGAIPFAWLCKRRILRPIHNPLEEALDRLAEARFMDPDADLVWLAKPQLKGENIGAAVRSRFIGRVVIQTAPSDEEPF